MPCATHVILGTCAGEVGLEPHFRRGFREIPGDSGRNAGRVLKSRLPVAISFQNDPVFTPQSRISYTRFAFFTSRVRACFMLFSKRHVGSWGSWGVVWESFWANLGSLLPPPPWVTPPGGGHLGAFWGCLSEPAGAARAWPPFTNSNGGISNSKWRAFLLSI